MKKYSSITGIRQRKIVKENCTLVTSITTKRAQKEKPRFTRSLVTLDSVKIYLGTYVFFNKEAFPVIEVKPWVVDSRIKLYRILPESR